MVRLGLGGFAAACGSWAVAVALVWVAETAVAQDEPVNRYVTYRGEGPGPIAIIPADGAVTYVQRVDVAPIILVQKAPLIPAPIAEPEEEEAPVEGEEVVEIVETIEEGIEAEAVDLDSPESRAKLEFATQQFLTSRAVPKLPQTRRSLTEPLPELAENEELALVTIESGIVQQNIPRLPDRGRYRSRAVSVAVALPEDVSEAATTVRADFQQAAVPVLPSSAQDRIARRGYRAEKDGLSGSEIRAQTPLHLLQDPPPQLPTDHGKRYR